MESLEAPPPLVVEVASKRSRLYDRNRKKDVYQGFGIPAYWILEPDPDRPQLIALELQGGRYEQVAEVAGDELFRAESPFPVVIKPSALVLRRAQLIAEPSNPNLLIRVPDDVYAALLRRMRSEQGSADARDPAAMRLPAVTRLLSRHF